MLPLFIIGVDGESTATSEIGGRRGWVYWFGKGVFWAKDEPQVVIFPKIGHFEGSFFETLRMDMEVEERANFFYRGENVIFDLRIGKSEERRFQGGIETYFWSRVLQVITILIFSGFQDFFE